jgi:hypothetical protein
VIYSLVCACAGFCLHFNVLFTFSQNITPSISSLAHALMIDKMADEHSVTLEDVASIELEHLASVPNLDNCTKCCCTDLCLKMRGRNACPCRSVQLFCTRVCHKDRECMNIRKVVGDTDSDDETTVRIDT